MLEAPVQRLRQCTPQRMLDVEEVGGMVGADLGGMGGQAAGLVATGHGHRDPQVGGRGLHRRRPRRRLTVRGLRLQHDEAADRVHRYQPHAFGERLILRQPDRALRHHRRLTRPLDLAEPGDLGRHG